MAGARDRAERPGYAGLAARVAQRDALIGELRGEIAALKTLIVERDALIVELRARLEKDSTNSSKPPSSDGYAKKPVKEEKRRRSERKQGGQEGHEGAHLKRVEVPHRRIVYEPEGCCEGCGRDLADAEEVGEETRQVFDIPEELALEVIEHAAKIARCAGCGRESTTVFPAGVTAPVSYGQRIKALGVYLHVFQHIPYDRARQLIFDLSGADLSTGTLKSWVDQAAAGLTVFDDELRRLLAGSPVVHFDETGARIAGRLGWIHSASTGTLTRYTTHSKRGVEAMDDAGVLPDFEGIAVHDGWKPYRSYEQAIHALCNAHHLRELISAEEAGQAWASGMGCLLLDASVMVDEAKAAGQKALGAEELAELHASYRTLIAAGYEENPGLAENAQKKMRRTDAQNLLLRLDEQEQEALRFAHDFRVSFTNNLAEADIRMVKLQQKISGCWRTHEGAERYLKVRSYISTARKQGRRPLDVLAQLAAGQPWLPAAGET